ncbi:MAG TPA: hypothetical protein VFM46_13095 [Pseudomonadales bacterium]|nr:hypothetical protein [Pseudomonadales bacterium]
MFSDIREGDDVTECWPVATLNPVSAFQLGAIGRAFSGTRLKAVGEEGKVRKS